jgi:hypothetical protein
MQQQIEKAVQEHLQALQRHSSNPYVNENIADESTVTQVPRKTQEKTSPGQPPTVAASPVTIDRLREFEMKQDQRYQELTSMLMSFLQDQRSDSSAGTAKRPAIIDLTDESPSHTTASLSCTSTQSEKRKRQDLKATPNKSTDPTEAVFSPPVSLQAPSTSVTATAANTPIMDLTYSPVAFGAAYPQAVE